ncbi:MAG TPA: M14 family metallopeptidase, partial [Fimbriimonadaceae bacterium]|nr:M14 family metallopeptidase [Fimbriimonadaceae bacterium]
MSPILALAALAAPALAPQQAVTPPEKFFGHEIGADYVLPNYQRLKAYWELLDRESDRMVLRTMGKTEEGRDQLMAIVSSGTNIRRLDHYKGIAQRLARAEGLTEEQAKQLSKEGKAVVWIDGGLHATEVLGAQQLMETLYRMISRNDEETRRILDEVIILFVHANPDGMDLVSDWYMRNPEPTRRSTANLPRLYQKYVGHDNNRDFYASTQKESENMNRVMYREWFPQIMYNHHQTGPRGTVMFAPPFRPPFNHHVDPLVMSGVELVGSAMHNRFIQEGKPGTTMRYGAGYSAWWNGGLRTTAYFHNIIGILTETIGSPNPMEIPFVPERQIMNGDLLFPIPPQTWKFRQSVEYSVTANLSILDLAARRRAHFLYGIYRMGKNSIDKGRADTWTNYPSRVATVMAQVGRDVDRAQTLLRVPELRDAKAYVIPSDQPDFPTAVKFVNALIETGVQVHRAS